MEQRINFITFATADLDAARSFYQDGLQWQPLLDVPDEIIFFQIGPGLVLGLFEAGKFDADLDREASDVSISGVTLSYNVDSPEAVDEIFQQALAAGGAVVKAPVHASFGGYHGHFQDPNGIIWEIAHNPGWSVDETGTVSLS
ncbi:MAG: VOC family protein [Nakamurella sp.]